VSGLIGVQLRFGVRHLVHYSGGSAAGRLIGHDGIHPTEVDDLSLEVIAHLTHGIFHEPRRDRRPISPWKGAALNAAMPTNCDPRQKFRPAKSIGARCAV